MIGSAEANPHYGPTLENEHLYRIALHILPNSHFTVQQVMVALLHKNPKAFNKGNINGLKSGYRLEMPSMDEIAKTSPRVAANDVDRQNKIWAGKAEIVAVKESAPQKTEEASFAQEFPHEATKLTNVPELAMTRFELAQAQENTSTPISWLNFMEETKNHEQETNKQISTLAQQTKNLESKISQLTEQLQAVTYHYIQLSALIKKQESGSYSAILIKNFKEHGLTLGGSVLLLGTLIWFYRRVGKGKVIKTEQGSEYNFLEGQDSIPTKLDLARAYIDMGDSSSAHAALADVMLRGDETQKQTARDLLSKLNLSR